MLLFSANRLNRCKCFYSAQTASHGLDEQAGQALSAERHSIQTRHIQYIQDSHDVGEQVGHGHSAEGQHGRVSAVRVVDDEDPAESRDPHEAYHEEVDHEGKIEAPALGPGFDAIIQLHSLWNDKGAQAGAKRRKVPRKARVLVSFDYDT